MCLTGIFIMLIRIKCLIPVRGGLRTYYYGCTREGGHSGWLNDNLKEAENAPEFMALPPSGHSMANGTPNNVSEIFGNVGLALHLKFKHDL